MQTLFRWIRRLRVLFRRERVEREMDEELRFHLDMETRSNLKAGMGAREARRQALLAFGGVERFKEWGREARGVRTLDDLATDFRVTFRGLRKSPAFTVLAILSLALGIGANTAIFSVVNALLIRQLPCEAPDELVTIYRESDWTRFGPLSYPDFLEVQRATTEVFSEVGGAWFAFVQREIGDGTETLVCEMVTGDYFQLLGVGTRMGRTISPEDHVAPGAHPAVVLGHRFWRESFGGDPQVVGRTIRLSGGAFTVVGVMEEEFRGSFPAVDVDVFAPVMMVDLLQPLMEGSLDSRGANAFRPMGRLSPGVTLAQANAALERVAARLKEDFPEIWQPTDGLYGLAADEVLVNPDADRAIVAGNLLAVGLVAMVLLIACANLASFLLARAVERRREIALRKALGASRGRLVRQVLTETLTLALLGGAVGILFALWLQELALGITLPLPVTLGFDLSLDWRVLLFTLGVTVATGVLVGALPALEATGREISPVLKGESAAASRPRAVLLSRILVTGQVAVSVVLLATAGLFLRSLGASRRLDPGFGTEPTARVSFMIPTGEFSEE
ncbi:MAG: ABC transporter permease, partial [Gemmatimonadota bacterium]